MLVNTNPYGFNIDKNVTVNGTITNPITIECTIKSSDWFKYSDRPYNNIGFEGSYGELLYSTIHPNIRVWQFIHRSYNNGIQWIIMGIYSEIYNFQNKKFDLYVDDSYIGTSSLVNFNKYYNYAKKESTKTFVKDQIVRGKLLVYN